jgi:uncharacterized protein (UPF0332 family)
MRAEDRAALVRYRLEKAERTLRQAETLAMAGEWDGAVNRAYYAMFYAAEALLAHLGLGARRHTGVLVLVDRELVAQGLVAPEQAARLREAYRVRQRADYADEAPVTADRGQELLAAARSFVAAAVHTIAAAGEVET